VCVIERTQADPGLERERERACVCVCMFVCLPMWAREQGERVCAPL